MNKKRLLSNCIIYCALIVAMSSCNVMQFKQPKEQLQDTTTWSTPEAEPIQNETVQNEVVATPKEPVKQKQGQQIIEIGNGQFTAPAKNKSYKENTEGDITLNFQSTDINEFVKVILSDLLNENYIVDPQVNGTVTIETGRPISKDNLFPLLDEVLAINNAALIRTGDLYKIVPRTKAIRGNLSPTDSTVSSANGYTVRTVPLTYIAAQEMQKILEPFVSENGEIRVDKQRNMLILAGTAEELNTLQETIDIFDVDWLRGMSVGLYPLDYVDPETLKAELDGILGGVEGASGDELLGGLVRTIALERLNSILLISSTVSALREAELWLYRLDRAGETIGQHLYVYDVQNAKAIELADILGHIFGNGESSSVSSAELAPGTTPVEISENDETSIQDNSTSRPPASVTGNEVSLAANDSIEIIADDTRNALVILATPQDYKMVAAAIKKLDIVPLQVLIEASILEVTLNDDLNYGVEWFFKNKLDDSHSGQGQLDLGDAGIAALAPSFSYTIINNASNVRVALNALQTESEINVLSSPSLMVLDNQTATINIGDEIPVPSRQSVSNIDPNAPTVNEIQYRNTGVTLEVTPRVNNSGLVTMDIRQEVSNAVTTTSSSIDAPTIQQRQIESTVAINTGETIVLGGLMQETDTVSDSGIPGLYKIPLIGKLFGQTNDSFRKTELIVLLTPRVIRSNNDAKKITDEFRRKLQNLPPI